jgi:hypothetical protein
MLYIFPTYGTPYTLVQTTKSTKRAIGKKQDDKCCVQVFWTFYIWDLGSGIWFLHERIRIIITRSCMTDRKIKKTKSADLQAQLESWVQQCDAIHSVGQALKEGDSGVPKCELHAACNWASSWMHRYWCIIAPATAMWPYGGIRWGVRAPRCQRRWQGLFPRLAEQWWGIYFYIMLHDFL